MQSLLVALDEVTALQRANPTPTGRAPSLPNITRAINRASVVILSSHFERYFYAVNEEACDVIAANGVHGQEIPSSLRLLHSRVTIDELAEAQWTGREPQLASFVADESWMWRTGEPGAITAGRLLGWMKAPKPESVIRYYSYWQIENIFEAITRLPQHRSFLWLKLRELVEKRNNIAHGDASEQATPTDIREYLRAVRIFCPRADRALARQLVSLFHVPRPW